MMTAEEEIRDPKRRVDLAETKIAQLEGSFQFVSGQLRDIQLYMHARFADLDKRLAGIDKRFADMDKRFDRLERNVEALPRVMAELLDERLGQRS